MPLSVAFKLEAYHHGRGTVQAPEHSEYELDMDLKDEIMAVKNAKVFGNFLQVIDEEKPIFVVLGGNYGGAWKIDCHLFGSTGKIVAELMKGSKIGAMFVEEARDFGAYSVRVGDEHYFAGDLSNVSGEVNAISLDDLLDFISGEIAWKCLKGRSFLHERKLAKEQSCQEKIIEARLQLQKKGDAYLRLERQFHQNKDETDNLEDELSAIPAWVRKFFLRNFSLAA